MWLEKRRRHRNIDTRENEKPQNQNDDVDGNVDIQEFTTHRTAILTTNTEPDVKQAIDGEMTVEKTYAEQQNCDANKSEENVDRGIPCEALSLNYRDKPHQRYITPEEKHATLNATRVYEH